MTAPVLRTLLRYSAWLLWVTGAVALGLVVIGLAFHSGGDLDGSMWESAGAAVRAVSFGAGIGATPALLPVLVAHGITRRRFAAAVGIVAVLLATAAGCYMAAGYLVERVVYSAADLPQDLADPHLFGSTGQVHLVFVEYALLCLAFLLSGWLVGIGYYGYGPWRGTALALPGLLPTAAVEYTLDTGWFASGLARLGVDLPGLPVVAVVGVAAAVAALALLAGRGLIHSVAVRSRRLS